MKNLSPGFAIYFQEMVLTVLSISIIAIEVAGLAIISNGILS